MPRYFFHIQDGSDFHDEEGTVLGGVEAARAEASRVAAAHLRDHPCDLWGDRVITVTAQDHRGLTLFTVTITGHDAAAVVADRGRASAANPA